MRSEEKSVRNSPANTEVREGGGGEGAPQGARAEITLQPMEDRSTSTYPCCSPWRTSWSILHGTELTLKQALSGAAACGGPNIEQVYPKGLQPLGTTLRAVREGLYPMGGMHAGAGKKQKELLWTDHNLHSPTSHWGWGEWKIWE